MLKRFLSVLLNFLIRLGNKEVSRAGIVGTCMTCVRLSLFAMLISCLLGVPYPQHLRMPLVAKGLLFFRS